MIRRSNTVEAKSSPSRNSAIELLRIISMLMIIFHHFAVHADFDWWQGTVTVPHLWYNFIIMGGKIGVNVFMLISGFFLIKDKSPLPSPKKLLKLWSQIVFYSILIYLVFTLTGLEEFKFDVFLQSFFPISFNTWWFATVYFIIYLLHPFLNKLLLDLSKKQYQYLLCVLLLFCSVIPTVTTISIHISSLVWFTTVYILAGYIRLFGLGKKLKRGHYLLIFLVATALTYLSSVLYTKFATFDNGLMPYITYFYGQEKIPVVVISVALFMFFLSLNMKPRKWLNKIASATFGVYLIHDHFFMRTFLWTTLFHNATYKFTGMIIPYSIGVVFATYVYCTLVDLVRQSIHDGIFRRAKSLGRGKSAP